jgi:branched-chain amino acid transport system permease protein
MSGSDVSVRLPTRRVVAERSTRASRWGAAAAVVGVVVLALAPILFVDSALDNLVEFLYLLALAQMWNLLAGYAGLVSIGQQAYIGLGGYGLLVLADHLGLNLYLSLALAGVAALVLALPTAFFVFRLRGGYFAIGTWVVAEVYRLVVANVEQVGGGSGVTLAAAAREIGDPSVRLRVTYWIALAVAVGSVALVYYLLRSRTGLALRAVRDRESAAPTLGIDVRRTKVMVYVLASAVTGLTGAVIYLKLLRLQPDAAFSVNWTAFMIFAVVIGGLGSITGPIVGTVLFFLLQEYLADLGPVYLIVLGAVAIGVMLRAPRGLWGLVTSRWDVRFFPTQLRVRVVEAPAPVAARPLAEGVGAPHNRKSAAAPVGEPRAAVEERG